MPHLAIQYSDNLDKRVDMAGLCSALASVLDAHPAFPTGGIRVRAYPAGHYAIADGHEDNLFCDLVLRMGQGRGDDEKKNAGEKLMECATGFFSEELKGGHFMLSLEIVEIEKNLSWKTNTVHARLAGEK